LSYLCERDRRLDLIRLGLCLMRRLAVACSVAVFMSHSGVNAAPVGVPDFSSTVSPGAVIESNRQDAPETKTTPKPSTIELPDDSGVSETISPQTPRFVLKGLTVEGATLLPAETLKRLSQAKVGEAVTLNDLLAITDALTQEYHRAGFITSRVYLPPQDVANGVITLKALEGKVGDIHVTVPENRPFWGYGQRTITPRIAISEGEPLNIQDLRRNLILLDETPDLDLKMILTPGQEASETDVELALGAKRPYHLRLSFDNLGRDLIGTERLGATLTHNNVLGFGDALTLGGGLSRGSQALNAGYTVPIGPYGTQLGGQAAYSWLKLGGPLKAANIQGKASIYSVFLRQPLWTRERLRVSADAGLDFKQLDTDFSHADLFRDQLRVGHVALNLDEFDNHGRTLLRTEVAAGFDIFGATTGNSVFSTGGTSSRPGGAGSQFIRVTPSITRLQRFPRGITGLFRLQGQYSPNSLVSSEQIQAGGAYTVRGYREGTLIGDSGLVGSAEFRFPLFFLPKDTMMPWAHDVSWRDAIQLVAFTDMGMTFVNRPAPGVDANDVLWSAGLGLRAMLSKSITARVDVGMPILTQPGNQNSPRIHFGFETQLF
jgi:hemolysin activation/secretion protein